MTQDHREALQRSIAAHRAVKEAMKDAAERLASERAAASEQEMALRFQGDATRKDQASNG